MDTQTDSQIGQVVESREQISTCIFSQRNGMPAALSFELNRSLEIRKTISPASYSRQRLMDGTYVQSRRRFLLCSLNVSLIL